MKRYYLDKKGKCLRQEETSAFNEAVMIFTGEIEYSSELQENCFEHMRKLFDDSDLALSPVTLGSSLLKDGKKQQFVENLGKAGLDVCLFGEKSSARYGEPNVMHLVPGEAQIINVNDISTGIVSSQTKTSRDIAKKVIPLVNGMRAAKAEFITVYLRCSSPVEDADVKALAEAGADYIILHQDAELMPYKKLICSDRREVPVIQSAGTAVRFGKECRTAAFRIKVMRDYEGKITLQDEFIPCIFDSSLPKRENCIVPTRGFYNGRYINEMTRSAAKQVRKSLGGKIKMSTRIRPFNNRSGFSPQLSIREIYSLLGVDSSLYNGEFPIDEKVHSIVIRNTELSEKCVAVLDKIFDEERQTTVIKEEMLQEKKPVMVIADRNIENVPTLIVESPQDAFITLSRHIRKKYDPFTVAITGSVGKSTVTDMIKTVMKYKYNIPDIRGNYNTFRSVGFCVQKLTDKHDGYVQELHGGSPGAASLGSSIVLPDVAVVTSIAEVHLEQLGNSIENVKNEKLGIADHIQEGGSLVVNNDNEYLQNLDMPVNVVTYGAFNKNSDYYAEDIEELEDRIRFTIVSKEGRFPAEIFCKGIHNVCNATGVFAVGRLAGMEPAQITSALSRYRTRGFRQNLIYKDGYKIFADCFNSAPESVKTALQSLSGIKPAPGGKKIAVLGDMNELAKMTEIRHRETGKLVAHSDADILITFGELAEYIAEEAVKEGMETYSFTDREEMENKIREITEPGDVILFKASHGVELDKSIVSIFGEI